MTATITMKMMEKRVKIGLSGNKLTLSTIRSQFFLPRKAIVALSYEDNGQKIGCSMNERGTVFVLPEGSSNMLFNVESDKVPSRPGSSLTSKEDSPEYHRESSVSPTVIKVIILSMVYRFISGFLENLAFELRSRLFYIPRAQKAFQEEGKTFARHEPDDTIDGGCASPISSRAAVTYAHRSHQILKEYEEGEDDEHNRHSIVEIRNAQDHNISHKMKVIVVDAHHDFVILRSKDGSEIFEDFPYTMRSPKPFEFFIGLGLSLKTENGQQITHRSGRVCSDRVNYRGRFLATSSIDGGDSGGPCYSTERALIGIMAPSTTTNPRLTREYDRNIIEEEIMEASSNPADIWITSIIFIAEAYDAYQVKHGIRLAHREMNMREPSAKRRAIGIP